MLEALPEDADAHAPDVTPRFEPQWARLLAFGSAALVIAFGGVSLALAVAGIDHSYLVFPLGAVAWLGLLLLARPMLVAPGASTPRAHLEAALAVVFVGAIAYWHARHASQHVLINRDGGAYTNAGRWIAAHGNLRVVPNVGPFAHQASLIFKSAAITQNHDGTLSFQFAHLLPSLLALAQRIGGDRLMFATPALLAGTALLALWVVAWRLLRYPFGALAAIVAFAFVMPEVSFSRDTYSEIPTQVVLFTALWMLIDRNVLRRPRLALLAGLFIGSLQGIRIDALAAMLGLPVLFALAWIQSDETDRPLVLRSAIACGIGLIPGVVIGFADVILRSHQYFTDLRSNLKLLAALMVASVILAIVVAFAARKVRAPSTRRTNLATNVVAVGVVAVGFLAWFVRPALQTTRGAPSRFVAGLQAAARVKVNPTRTYFEQSMHWMSWYLGPVVVAAGIVGAALLAHAFIRTRRLGPAALVAMLGPASAIYLWKARAAPDQIWVMRRFLDSAVPLLLLLAFGLVVMLLRWVPSRFPRAIPVVVAVVIVAFAIGYPISTTVHIRAMTEQRGDLAIVKDACRTVGKGGAIVVVIDETAIANNPFPQTLRGWCDVPVATMVSNANSQSTLERLAAQWEKQGRHLWAVSGNGAMMHKALPSVKAISTPMASNGFFLERTLVARPEHYAVEHLSFVLARVPAG